MPITNDNKNYLIHIHLRGDKKCYWFAADARSKLSSRAECATALNDAELANSLLVMSVVYGSKLESISPFKINACPMLDELREARK